MKRFLAVFIIGALALLSACGGDKPTITPPVTPPVTQPPSTGVVTPIGENIGAPVTQTIGAAGGVVTLSKVTVSAPSGAFNGSSLRLQAITDTFNNAGQGIAISSDASWNKYLTMTFPIDPSEGSPESLGLAVQQADGSWRSLEPVKVDMAAGTVSAGLPAVTEVSAARVRAQGLLDLKRVIAFNTFYMKPASATLKVGKTQVFTPYAQVLERPKGCPSQSAVGDDLEPLLPPKCYSSVTREYPFTNNKDPFIRTWFVNGVVGGNASVGTIVANGSSGATYTAPDKQPSPDTVTVTFQSYNSDTLVDVRPRPTARVKIAGDLPQAYTGPLEFSGAYSNGTTFSGTANLTWQYKVGNYESSVYEATGSVEATNIIPGCSPVTATVPAVGDLSVYQAGLIGPGVPLASGYFFNLVYGEIVTAQCGNPPKPRQVLLQFFIESTCKKGVAGAQKYTDSSALVGSLSCNLSNSQPSSIKANWNLAGN